MQLRASGASQLPRRISLFGYTRLSLTDIELLDALSVHHDLHLWRRTSDELWSALDGRPGWCSAPTITAIAACGTLLATLGRGSA